MIDFKYYLITDRQQCATQKLPEQVEKACEAGIKAVQLREKDLSDKSLLELADVIRGITHSYDTRLFINDRVDIAMLVEADGVHCRETSLSPKVVKQLDSNMMVGASVHSLERAKKVEKEGADFVLFGPVFDTPSKREYGDPKGLVALQEITHFMRIPVFAVGGVNTDNADRCIEYNADGVAGISSIMNAGNPANVIETYQKILDGL